MATFVNAKTVVLLIALGLLVSAIALDVHGIKRAISPAPQAAPKKAKPSNLSGMERTAFDAELK